MSLLHCVDPFLSGHRLLHGLPRIPLVPYLDLDGPVGGEDHFGGLSALEVHSVVFLVLYVDLSLKVPRPLQKSSYPSREFERSGLRRTPSTSTVSVFGHSVGTASKKTPKRVSVETREDHVEVGNKRSKYRTNSVFTDVTECPQTHIG